MRKLIPGGTNHSFGINVAKMAGMPKFITDRAYEILLDLESFDKKNIQPLSRIKKKKYELSLIDIDPSYLKIRKILENLNIDSLSPIEALLKLNELKIVSQKNFDK